uniref:Uncharacterized protein n=1 Tax=Anguilla anguilla TaxID=7936 RepID=A0A0E9SUK8_ANGAN
MHHNKTVQYRTKQFAFHFLDFLNLETTFLKNVTI